MRGSVSAAVTWSAFHFLRSFFRLIVLVVEHQVSVSSHRFRQHCDAAINRSLPNISQSWPLYLRLLCRLLGVWSVSLELDQQPRYVSSNQLWNYLASSFLECARQATGPTFLTSHCTCALLRFHLDLSHHCFLVQETLDAPFFLVAYHHSLLAKLRQKFWHFSYCMSRWAFLCE